MIRENQAIRANLRIDSGESSRNPARNNSSEIFWRSDKMAIAQLIYSWKHATRTIRKQRATIKLLNRPENHSPRGVLRNRLRQFRQFLLSAVAIFPLFHVSGLRCFPSPSHPIGCTPRVSCDNTFRKSQFVHKMFVHNFCAHYPPPLPANKMRDFLLNFY